ncbi:hypothetical protein D3C80_1768580 [compost metagenome]
MPMSWNRAPMPTWRIASAGNLHSLASSMLSTLTLREWNWRLLPSALSETRCNTISSTDSSCSVMALISSWASLMALRGRDWILPIRLRTWARDCWKCFSHCCRSRR